MTEEFHTREWNFETDLHVPVVVIENLNSLFISLIYIIYYIEWCFSESFPSEYNSQHKKARLKLEA